MNDPKVPVTPTIIPAKMLSDEALGGLIEEFILREGTDYGVKEYTLEEKIKQVRAQLDGGHVWVVFDPQLQSASLVRKEHLPKNIRNL